TRANLFKAKNKQFSGAWNNILPCYVVDTEESWRRGNVKLHEDPRKLNLEDQTIRDFEEKYKQYMDNNVDFGRALSTNAKHTKIALQGFEKMPTISPHVYSLLGPSHELRIKQALAEGVTRKKLARSSMELNGLNENSLSFRLDEDDDFSSRTTTASNKNWLARSTRSPSRRSTMESSVKVDRGITMLKSKRCKPKDHATHDASKLITIKPSFGALKKTLSKTSSTKSPFRGMLESRPSTNSLLSTNLSPETTRKYRKCVYLNTLARCVQFRSRDHKTVPVLVNYQIQALVQAVLEVLERVNPEKSRIIIETARDTEEIRRILLRPEMQSFVQSLLGQSLVSSPESYVVSTATLMDEIDCRFEGILEKEIIALTLEMPLTPSLDALISEIRSNIFLDAKKKPQMNENAKEIASSSNGRKVEKMNDEKDAKVMQADGR
ncbi:uncharacterized protein LOC128882126, partial [Hylaeus volcanicus]|uniref:uncharacterized protein LOC128882126 n=1 Tax=Hylaeus volcanicus TaxID=313075 RepID=UPI0023B7F7F6